MNACFYTGRNYSVVGIDGKVYTKIKHPDADVNYSVHCKNGSTRTLRTPAILAQIDAAIVELAHAEALEMNISEAQAMPYLAQKEFAAMIAEDKAMAVSRDHAEALEENDMFDGIIRDSLTPEQRAIHIRRQSIDIYGERFKAMLEADYAEAIEINLVYNEVLFSKSSYALQEIWGIFSSPMQLKIVDDAHTAALEFNADSTNRKRKLEAIWRGTHRDYKSTIDGVRSIMVCRGSTQMIPLTELTNTEIDKRSRFWK